MKTTLKTLTLATCYAAFAITLSSCGGSSSDSPNVDLLPDIYDLDFQDNTTVTLSEGQIQLNEIITAVQGTQTATISWDFIPLNGSGEVTISQNDATYTYDANTGLLTIDFVNNTDDAPAYSGTLSMYIYRISDTQVGIRGSSSIIIDKYSYDIVTDEFEIVSDNRQ